jgi:pimeloyl-ACP methyl ester carboxylesterase
VSKALVNGITIGYDDVGGGPDALMLVHGHPFDRSMWRPQVEGLAGSGWRIVVPDLRGYGESSTVSGKTTLGLFADDIAALLDFLEVDTAVIGGLSMGGQIVMEFCRVYRSRVRGVLLAATFPRAETEEGRRKRIEMAERLEREGMEGYAAEVLPKMLSARSIAALPWAADEVFSMMCQTDPAGAAAALRGRAERPDYEETLARLAIPALVVVGDQDVFTTRADAHRMQALLQGSELLWMEGVGHMPNLERSDDFNNAVRRLLSVVSESVISNQYRSWDPRFRIQEELDWEIRAPAPSF